CRVDCADRALSHLPLDHAASRYRQGFLAWLHGVRRATVAARPRMDEGERLAATHHPAPNPRAWPTALARLRRSVDRRLAEQRLEQRSQRRHDALLPADDGTADGRGAKRRSKTVGPLGAVFAPLDAEDQAGEPAIVRWAAEISLRALGVAPPTDIREHFIRWKYVNLPAALAFLEKQGRIVPVTVRDGDRPWMGTWYVHADDLAILDRIEAGTWSPRTTLLSPFDNLIIDRRRTRLMFGFDYTMEIY